MALLAGRRGEEEMSIDSIEETGKKGKEHARLDVVLLPDHMLRHLQPQLLPQQIVLLRLVRAHLSQLEIVLLQRQLDALVIQPHLRIDHDARLGTLVRATEAERVVEVVVGVVGVRVCRGGFEEADEGAFIDLGRRGRRRGRGRGAGCEEGDEGVVDCWVGVVLLEDGVEEVPNEVLCRGRRGGAGGSGGERGRWSRCGESGDEAADGEARLAEEDVDGLFW